MPPAIALPRNGARPRAAAPVPREPSEAPEIAARQTNHFPRDSNLDADAIRQVLTRSLVWQGGAGRSIAAMNSAGATAPLASKAKRRLHHPKVKVAPVRPGPHHPTSAISRPVRTTPTKRAGVVSEAMLRPPLRRPAANSARDPRSGREYGRTGSDGRRSAQARS